MEVIVSHTAPYSAGVPYFYRRENRQSDQGQNHGWRQQKRDYISKEDTISPTVATESVLLSCNIDVEEERDVHVIDILNAFIQTQVEDEKGMAFIKICVVLVDILVGIGAGSVSGILWRQS